MHIENLRPLADLWPILLLMTVLLAGWQIRTRTLRFRQLRHDEDVQRRYWIAEMAHRAKMWSLEWIARSRTPRLTYQPATEDNRD